MSEYQYYEFLAVDRRLTKEQIAEIRRISTRARVTPTHFVNEYNWGDFKGDEGDFLKRFFDLHLYFANWGTRRFMMSVPRHVVRPEEVEPYCGDDEFTCRVAGDVLILDFTSEDEEREYEDDEDEGLLAALAPVRDELLRGDRRVLYLGWLLQVQRLADYVDDESELDEVEPPVPPGLGSLSAPLETLAEFLRVDPDLIAAAAQESGGRSVEESDAGLAEWIAALRAEEKDRLLLEAARGGDASFGPKLLARFRASRKEKQAPAERGRRTVRDLLEAARLL